MQTSDTQGRSLAGIRLCGRREPWSGAVRGGVTSMRYLCFVNMCSKKNKKKKREQIARRYVQTTDNETLYAHDVVVEYNILYALSLHCARQNNTLLLYHVVYV